MERKGIICGAGLRTRQSFGNSRALDSGQFEVELQYPPRSPAWHYAAFLNFEAACPMIYPKFVDHLVFRVAELEKTERFYTALLGQPPVEGEGSLMYKVGDIRLFFTRCNQNQPRPYEKEQVGLNHIAFGLRTLEELQTIQARLDGTGIPHSGIRLDQYGLKEFIWLDDPDGMRIEFYLRPL
jgi:glyoxylase I family protein